MKVRGSAYEVVAVFNPLGRTPSRVYPVYQLCGEGKPTGRLFQQVTNDKGQIEDFREHRKTNTERLIHTTDGSRKSFVGQLALHGFAHSANNVLLFRGLHSYKGYFAEFMTEDRFRELKDYPICAVELARFVGNEEYETKYTKIATKFLAKMSVDVAQGWLNYSPLSIPAQEAGFRALENFKKDNQLVEFPANIRCIQLGESTFLQGDFVRNLWNGKIQVRIGRKVFKGMPVRSMRRGQGPSNILNSR